MRYLILIPDYTGSCIRDEFDGEINISNLGLSKLTINELTSWHDEYRKIIPLNMDEREAKKDHIEELDKQGLEIAKKIQHEVKGAARVKYFSEGKLKYLS